MDILEDVEAFNEDMNYDHRIIIYKHKDNLYKLTTKNRGKDFKLNQEDDELINIKLIYPIYNNYKIFKGNIEDAYIKKPSLLSYDKNSNNTDLIIREMRFLEELKEVEGVCGYHGCVVEDGLVKGLALTKYKYDLYEFIESKIGEIKVIDFLSKLVKTIDDIHSHNIIHGDLNPHNIMVNNNNPIIIDFDSSGYIGKKLEKKFGTFGWEVENNGFYDRKIDYQGIGLISKYLFDNV